MIEKHHSFDANKREEVYKKAEEKKVFRKIYFPTKDILQEVENQNDHGYGTGPPD